jgi:uncharacterized membrane protein
MTTLTEGSAPGLGGRHRLLWGVLTVSLVLNALMLGAFLWVRFHVDMPIPPAQRMQAIAKELNLNEDQRDALQHFIVEMRQNTRHLRESNQPLIHGIWEEIAKPQPDLDLINRSIDQATENRHNYQRTMTSALTQFLATLSPEQRGEFINLTKKQNDPRAQHVRRLIMP